MRAKKYVSPYRSGILECETKIRKKYTEISASPCRMNFRLVMFLKKMIPFIAFF